MPKPMELQFTGVYGLNQSKNGQSKVKWNRYLITFQMNEINYKANMLQSESFKLYLLYLDYCKPERERVRAE